MKTFLTHLIYGGTLILVLTGCGRSSSFEEPPRERYHLVMRFFDSMQNNRPQEAVQQGQKLLKQDLANQYLRELIYIQKYNEAILEARKALNAGRFTEAEAILTRGADAVSVNRGLLNERAKIQHLRHLAKALDAMKRASGAAAMQSALDRAVALTGSRPPAKVSRYFAAYRQKIKLRRQQEEAAARQAAALKKTANPAKPAARP